MARLFFHDIQSSNTSAHTIHNLLTVNAQHHPQAMALTAPGRLPLSYGRLLQHIDVVTGALHTLGVGRNDRVALVLPQGPEMAVAFLAVASVRPVRHSILPIRPTSLPYTSPIYRPRP